MDPAGASIGLVEIDTEAHIGADSMDVCDHCKEQMGANQPDARRPFPAFAVAGGILGTLGAVASGAILLVPAAVVVGALADTRHCGVCGSEIEDEASGYRVMTSEDDDLVDQVYHPVVRPPFHEDERADLGIFPGDLPETPTGQSQPEFVYDHIGGVLVQRGASFAEGDSFGDIAGAPSSDLGSAGMNGMEGFGQMGGPSAGSSAQ